MGSGRRALLGAAPLVVLTAATTVVLGSEPERPLVPGDHLPSLQGTTLSGKVRTVPEAGRAALLVVGFSKDAAPSMIPWLSACRSRDPSLAPAVACYDVRMVQGIPGFIRGFVERAMRKEYPEDLRDDALLVSRDNGQWKLRLAVRDPKVAQVVIVDTEGRVVAVAAGLGSAAELEALLDTLP